MKTFRQLTPVIDKLLVYIKNNSSSVTQAKRYVASITYNLEREYTPAQRAVLEPLRDELLAVTDSDTGKIVLSAEDHQEFLKKFANGVLARKYIKSRFEQWQDENLIIPGFKSAIMAKHQEFNTGRDVDIQRSLKCLKEAVRELEVQYG